MSKVLLILAISNPFRIYLNDLKTSIKVLPEHREYIGFSVFTVPLISFLDTEVEKWVKGHQNTSLNQFFDFFNNFGTPGWVIPSLVGTAELGYLTKNKKLYETSIVSLESGFTSANLAILIKVLSGRARPEEGKGAYYFQPLNTKDAYNSFPSGHATIAWSVITPFALSYKAYYLFLIPIIVNGSRVHKHRHWLSDTFAGSFLGFGVGFLLYQAHFKKL